MKKFLAGCIAILILCGCSNVKAESSTYILKNQSVQVTQIIEYKEDRILKQISTTEIDYEKVGITKEYAKNLSKEFKNKYDLNGVSYDASFTEEKMIEKISIDYNKVDLKDLKEAELVSVTAGYNEKILFVSYKQTIEGLEKSGFVKQ